MKIKVKKLHSEAKLPTKAHVSEDAGWDIYSIVDIAIGPNPSEVVEVHTGIAIEIPKGYFGLVGTRSSFGKKGWRVHAGILDAGYRGEITLFVSGVTDYSQISVGDRVAQLLILPVPEVEMEEADVLSDSDRGSNGFGSTGR